MEWEYRRRNKREWKVMRGKWETELKWDTNIGEGVDEEKERVEEE